MPPLPGAHAGFAHAGSGARSDAPVAAAADASLATAATSNGTQLRVYDAETLLTERWEQTYTTSIEATPESERGKHRFVLFDRGHCADFKRVRVLPVVR